MIYLDSAATSLLKPPSVARATAMAVRTWQVPAAAATAPPCVRPIRCLPAEKQRRNCFMFRSRSVSCSP